MAFQLVDEKAPCRRLTSTLHPGRTLRRRQALLRQTRGSRFDDDTMLLSGFSTETFRELSRFGVPASRQWDREICKFLQVTASRGWISIEPHTTKARPALPGAQLGARRGQRFEKGHGTRADPKGCVLFFASQALRNLCRGQWAGAALPTQRGAVVAPEQLRTWDNERRGRDVGVKREKLGLAIPKVLIQAGSQDRYRRSVFDYAI
jgi:hypothetical protein